MRRLVICCDGTWNRADQESNGRACPTNVVQLAFRAASADGAVSQLIYYDQGVGIGNWLDRLGGGAFGDGLEANIHDAYRFLVANYRNGDEIFLFGFSRGAFTARSLGGMIRKCGILSRKSVARYGDALKLYRNEERPDDPGPKAFRAAHSCCGGEAVEIKFIGVWDTVGALGIPVRGLSWIDGNKYKFHDTELSWFVRNAYHALAIDERRGPFTPTLWAFRPKEGQVVEQVWFCGVHSDVGGGYADREPSDLALQWLLEKARENGLALDAEATSAYPLGTNAHGELHDSMSFMYRFGAIDRVIGVATEPDGKIPPGPHKPDPRQSLHPSVLQRWDRDPRYRPKNLRAYLRLIGDPRGSA